MKSAVLLALPVLALGSLGACAPSNPSTGQPPVSTNVTGSSGTMPQPPNSLPDGAAVNAPLTRPTGVVGTTRVTPVR